MERIRDSFDVVEKDMGLLLPEGVQCILQCLAITTFVSRFVYRDPKGVYPSPR